MAARGRGEDTRSGFRNLKLAYSGPNLCNADLSRKDLTDADLTRVNLDGATLIKTSFERANLTEAKLNMADLRAANLRGARLDHAQMNRADLRLADLRDSVLQQVTLEGAKLSSANLAGAYYAPVSLPPDPYLVGVKGIQSVRLGQSVGMVQLRELFQKDGLRDLEREATYAIEHHRTQQQLRSGGILGTIEGLFRYVFFEITTDYGLNAGRALWIIAGLWLVMAIAYVGPLSSWPVPVPEWVGRGKIYRIWPSDRIEPGMGETILVKDTKIELLKLSLAHAVQLSAYFSLLSAFHFGWRELNIGTWLSRVQPWEYSLRPVGWVRAVSGFQSLSSIYLLAIWALTYFGRPFQ